MNKKQEILKLVKEYIQESYEPWQEGDWIHYAGPVFDDKEYVAAINSLLDKWLILGDKGLEFERQFPKYLGKRHGVLVNSGSSANLLMMGLFTSKYLKDKYPKRTKIITPVSCFPTTINPILFYGFQPVFIDVTLPNLNLNLDQVEEAAKDPDVRFITFAHTLGVPPNMDRLMEIVRKYNLIFLEDTCDALDSKWGDKLLGSFGHVSTCSFYPAHHITIGEGGFVATDSIVDNGVLLKLRDWGRGCMCKGKEANLLPNGICGTRFSNWFPNHPEIVIDHKYVFDEIGFNFKPLELQAAIGLEQIKKIPEFTKARKRNYQLMYDMFKPYEEFFHLPEVDKKADPSWFAFLLTLKDNVPFTREEFTQCLEKNKIQTRPNFAGNILYHPGYSHLLSTEKITKFKVADKSVKDSFFLGLSPLATDSQISYISKIVDEFMRGKF